MITFPNAKINIGLQILEKRPDNFHNIASCFYPVGCQDVLEILPQPNFEFKTTGIQIPDDGKENICVRAYQLLKKTFDLPSVLIHLHKVIPIGAGLGGGSADAAYTLKMLNELFSLSLSSAQLEEYARHLGSDCAFFIENKPQYCTQKGDIFEDIAISLQNKWVVLVYPAHHISTQEAYQQVKPKADVIPLKELLKKPIIDWKDIIQNDFKPPLFAKYPFLRQIEQNLYQQGALYASMTGSGSTIFGIFDEPISLKKSFSETFWIWEGFLK